MHRRKTRATWFVFFVYPAWRANQILVNGTSPQSGGRQSELQVRYRQRYGSNEAVGSERYTAH